MTLGTVPPAEASWLPMEGTPLRLILLRHGEVHEDDRTFLYGQRDVRLSEAGLEQSRLTGEALRSVKVDAVYTSDLRRAHTLGSEVSRHHGIEPVTDPRLRERHFGHWQDIPMKELESRFPEEMASYRADRFTMRAPGGAENFEDVGNRVLEFVREAAERHAGEAVVLAAHSGPVRVVLAAALGLPVTSLFTFGLDYCSLSVVEHFASGRVRVQLINSTYHLAGTNGNSPLG